MNQRIIAPDELPIDAFAEQMEHTITVDLKLWELLDTVCLMRSVLLQIDVPDEPRERLEEISRHLVRAWLEDPADMSVVRELLVDTGYQVVDEFVRTAHPEAWQTG